MVAREAEIIDAEQLANLIQSVDQTSQYMLWEPGERNLSAENQVKMIKSIKDSENSTLLVAEENHKLVGYLLVIGGKARRNKHSGYIVTGIHTDFRGKGVGTLLFKKVEEWVSKQKLRRLELTVVKHNEAGVHLYKKMGFEIEGIKRESLFIDGKYVDEYYMSKLL